VRGHPIGGTGRPRSGPAYRQSKHNLPVRVVQRCAGTGVQESTPARVGIFEQEPEQDQEWIFSIGTGAGVIFNHSAFDICIDYLQSTQFVTGVKQEQESIIFL